ncbi:MAG: enoyl-CoA hydratase [Gammaproteobacteria bacterium]|nr:enoyl-CoA hydratase [Gammaproteobacteria bacterium]
MTYTRLRSEIDNKVGRITLSKPDEFNRMPPAFWSEFPDAIEEMDESGAIRALVISAEGKHFTSGMDTSVFTSGRSGPEYEAGRRGERSRRHIARLQDSFSVIERVRMPVIAAIQGACIGGGVDMISACDMRYCTSDAFFCIQEINIGMAADVGTLQRLPNLIPTGLMRELAYTGRRLFAEEAKSIGLVNEVYDTHSHMLEAVMSIAEEIAKKSPLAVASTKHLLGYGEEHSVSDTLDYQTLWMGSISQGGEMAKYFNAKQQGNEPEFDDLPPLSDD